MTRVDEFNSFYSSTSRDALSVTYALCGDRQVALEATADAYRRAWRDWSKIRDRSPLAYVRNEAWKLTAVSRTTHPLRRKHEEGADTELLGALADLPSDHRRLIVLLTLGDTDLEQASREVGVTAEDGIEAVTTALDRLEKALEQPLDVLERRTRDLGTVTGRLEMPPSADIRQAAQRGRMRNTVLLVAAAVVLVLGGGFVVSDGDALASRADLPRREKIGDERPDIVLEARKLSEDNLLSTRQIGSLGAGEAWRTVGTDEKVDAKTPYATCPTRRFAGDDTIKAYVRTYAGAGPAKARAAQSIEVSSTSQEAEAAYRTTVGWYADCEHPRVQLVGSYVVQRPFGDFRILRLRSHRSPERTFTVGFAHSGRVTLTLVHEIDGAKGPSVEQFTRTLNASVAKICSDSGGRCTDDTEVVKAAPPRTSTAPTFLGIVDLPPVADVDKVWSGIAPYTPKQNPAATVCDAADFDSDEVQDVKSRVFVIPEAPELPQEFGVAETVAGFDSDDDAKKFVDKVEKKIKACPDDNLAADVKDSDKVKGAGLDGRAWRIAFEVSKKKVVENRMAIVRRGSHVA
ncbi:MAG: hypothetical protein EON52_01010, partial [Actinomycetales bacterium]